MKTLKGKEKSICEIADKLQEGKVYIAILKDGDKIRVLKNSQEDIDTHTTGILTTWKYYENLNIEEWSFQDISSYILSFEPAFIQEKEYKDYEDLEENDLWKPECKDIVLKGPEGILVDSTENQDYNYVVPDETLPECFWD